VAINFQGMKQTTHIRLQGSIPRWHQDDGGLLTSVWRSKRFVQKRCLLTRAVIAQSPQRRAIGSMAVVQFLTEPKLCLYPTASRPALGPTHTHGGVLLGDKVARCETDNSPPATAEVKNGGPIPPLLHVVVLNYAQRL
jgi:hypothetical protein